MSVSGLVVRGGEVARKRKKKIKTETGEFSRWLVHSKAVHYISFSSLRPFPKLGKTTKRAG